MTEAYTTGTDIATVVAANPVTALTDPATYTAFYAHIKAETEAFVPDLSTVTSRGKISALAYKVTRTKTAIDAAGKKLNEEARAQIGKVDEQRRKIRGDLEALAESVRKPLTEWESAEEARIAACKAAISHLEEIGNLKLNGANAMFQELFGAVEALDTDAAFFGEFADEVRRLKASTVDKLNTAQAAHIKAEADRLELEALRKAEADRKATEAAAFAEAMKIAAADKEKAVQAERERLAEERVGRLAEEAAARAREEERRIAAEAVARAEREKQAVIDAQRQAEAERTAKAAREASEQAARDADKKHRDEVTASVGECLVICGASKATASRIVAALIAGEVPHVTLRF